MAENYGDVLGRRLSTLSLKHELRVMQSQGSGSIVNVSSTMGKHGAANLSLYTASKHAVEGLTKLQRSKPSQRASGLHQTGRFVRSARPRPASDGGGAHLRSALYAVHTGLDCGRGRSRCAGSIGTELPAAGMAQPLRETRTFQRPRKHQPSKRDAATQRQTFRPCRRRPKRTSPESRGLLRSMTSSNLVEGFVVII
jgi:hypothetical protein